MDNLKRRNINYRNTILNISILFFYLLALFIFFGLSFFDNSEVYAQKKTPETSPITLPYFNNLLVPKELFPKIVTVKMENSSTNYIVYSKFAKDIVKEIGIELDSNDLIIPSKNYNVPSHGKIKIVTVEMKYVKENYKIDIETKYKIDDTKLKNYEESIQEGIAGEGVRTYKETYYDNTLIEKELQNTEILIPMVERIVIKGSKPVPIHSCSFWNKVIDKQVPKEKNKTKNTWMKYVMLCESGCDPLKNTSEHYFGLYQFSPKTFTAYGGKDIFDGYDQIKIVSLMYDLQGNPAHHWPACNRAFERDYYK